ncbi:MAG: GIY-YIG nuclease family protein [Kiritimatiellia bacterium]
MWTVYIIRSLSRPEQRYIGLTTDLIARLATHNAGGSPHTSKYCPWELETAIAFKEQDKAAAFERYLKTGSGFAFAKKHFQPPSRQP